jgi:hypothetical protein
MSASIQYLLLDSDYDPVFDASASLTGTYAVAQAIDTRLKLFLGEWWENRNLGLPVFQVILGQLGSTQGLAAMTLAVQQNIQGSPYVTGTSDVSVTFTNGRLAITYTAQTQFGTVASTVTSANLG